MEIHSSIVSAMNGANLEKILIKIGMEVLHQLFEHYKKFTVNSIGDCAHQGCYSVPVGD